jgi:hypothetical protein
LPSSSSDEFPNDAASTNEGATGTASDGGFAESPLCLRLSKTPAY